MADDLACWISDRPGRFAEGACVPAATDASHPSETLVCAIVGRTERIYEAFGKIGVLDAIAGHRPVAPTSWESNRPLTHPTSRPSGYRHPCLYHLYCGAYDAASYRGIKPLSSSHPSDCSRCLILAIQYPVTPHIHMHSMLRTSNRISHCLPSIIANLSEIPYQLRHLVHPILCIPYLTCLATRFAYQLFSNETLHPECSMYG